MKLLTRQKIIENTIIHRCKKGENSAFEEIYNKYKKAMFNISYRLLNNLDDSNDVLQESFIKAFQNISKFENEVAFGSWLKRVVINHSIDILKKQKNNSISVDELDIIDEIDEPKDIKYDIEIVKKCIQELPDGYRIVLTLYLFEEYSHKEIASTLKISEGTSKSQYNRAKKKIIQLIQDKN
jgi:RNA polymerase sigma-70 factor (ECF subfamily)